MKRVFTVVFIFPFLVLASLGPKICKEDEYPLGDLKCCKYCSPGMAMKIRCDARSETQCEPCDSLSYKDKFYEAKCKPCTTCHEEKGLKEVKKCERTSNTVCVCLAGYSPAPEKPASNGKECLPCREGSFSRGGDEQCRPLTNCAAKGRRALVNGTKEKDNVCDDQPSTSLNRVVSTTLRPRLQWAGSTLATEPMSTPMALSTHSKEEMPANRGFLSIYISCTMIFFIVIGIAVVGFLRNRQKKKKLDLRGTELPFHEGKRSSYQIPIQEEQMDLKSSLVRN